MDERRPLDLDNTSFWMRRHTGMTEDLLPQQVRAVSQLAGPFQPSCEMLAARPMCHGYKKWR